MFKLNVHFIMFIRFLLFHFQILQMDKKTKLKRLNTFRFVFPKIGLLFRCFVVVVNVVVVVVFVFVVQHAMKKVVRKAK